MTIEARFSNPTPVASAIEALKQAGVDASRIDLYSAKPVELEPGVLDRPSRMSFAAVVGAILVGGGMTAFMYWAQRDYPLVTGGMPLNSIWGTGVISFESTMAGSILATALMFLKEGGLAPWKSSGPAPVTSGEEVVLRVSCSEDEAERLRAALADNGGAA